MNYTQVVKSLYQAGWRKQQGDLVGQQIFSEHLQVVVMVTAKKTTKKKVKKKKMHVRVGVSVSLFKLQKPTNSEILKTYKYLQQYMERMWLCLRDTFQKTNPQFGHSPHLQPTNIKKIRYLLITLPASKFPHLRNHQVQNSNAGSPISVSVNLPVYLQVWRVFP